ncbi:uncharacterized protein LOC114363555 [Ostrinia furnacalis]|uniref:uncharacterized protein LOC114363555 n=1 Tax=Ostrinia furnacalis TaxID=93504 RepID=UPI00103D642E|nr:uncharacterized protein LOC114363555 [Ostrinia furnacalis]
MEKLISGVRAEPCLWNPVHSDYREVLEREAAWQRVVTHCNCKSIPDVKAARAAWRKLRDNHREALKRAKLGQNKLLPAQITTWKYAKAMQFLEPYMKYRITETIEADGLDEKDVNTLDSDVSTSDNGNVSQDVLCSAQKRRCVENTGDSTSRPQFASESSLRLTQADALESFFGCMLKSTREMPLWMQTQVKKKIFAIIIDAEEQLSSNNRNDESNTQNIPTITNIKTEVIYPEDTY